MTAPVGPWAALTGLLQGMNEGKERERRIARESALDAEAKAERTQSDAITQSDATMRQAEFRNRLGLVEDDGAPSMVMGAPRPAQAPSLLHAAVTAFQTNGNPPRYTVPNLQGGGATTYRVDPTQTPEAIKTREAQALQADITKRAEEKEAADVAKQGAKETADAGKVRADAIAKKQEIFNTLSTIPGFGVKPAYKQFNPSYDYQLDADIYKAQASKPDKVAGETGSWEETKLTKNGRPQQRNTKTGEYRDVPDGLSSADQDNPQQLMQGTRGVQGARMMLLSHQQMKPFEAAATKDPSKFTGWDQFQAQFANDFASGKITNLGDAERSAALVNLNKTNPDLAQYIRSGLYYAFGENELQQRPSDFRTKMSDYLATIGPEMNPKQIHQVSSMREESMRPAVEAANRIRKRMKLPDDPMFDTYLGTGQAKTNAPAGGNTLTQQQIKEAGLTKEEVAAMQRAGTKIVP